MKVFCDFHHGALARAMFYLFCDRLGHDFSFMNAVGCVDVGAAHDGTWGCPAGDFWANHGIPEELHEGKFSFIGKDEFMDSHWDIMLLTRPESQRIFRKWGHPKPGTIYIGVSGNEGTRYDWRWVQNLISTDLMSFQISPPDLHKINTPQELGRHFDKGFVPIAAEDLHVISTFINNFRGYNSIIKPRNAPGGVNIFKIWNDTAAAMPGYQFDVYGHTNEGIGGPCITDARLAPYYHHSALTYNYKTYEGYGHALLQALPAGRVPIVPTGFFRDRMAGKYLIEGETCITCDYDPKDIEAKIRAYTVDLDTANERALRCYEGYKRLMDWPGEAERVRLWMEDARAQT